MTEFEKPEWWHSTMSVMDMLDDIEEVGCIRSMDLGEYYGISILDEIKLLTRDVSKAR